MPASYYFDNDTASWRMSRVTETIVMGVDVDAIIEQRRANFSVLRDALSPAVVANMLATDLPDTVCPLALPLLVQHRASWTTALHGRGIMAVEWWAGYHPSLDWDGFPEACYLKDHLLTLPIHHDLGAKHMKYIGRCVNEIAAAMGSVASNGSATRRAADELRPLAY